jgi:hypothetical protein
MDKSLIEKLGIKSGYILYQNFGGDYLKLLGAENMDLHQTQYPDKDSTDMIHFFCHNYQEAERGIFEFKNKIKRDGMIWISWPKKNSKINVQISENQIRQIALDCGLVDIKVCSINHTWSALKLVYRKKDR